MRMGKITLSIFFLLTLLAITVAVIAQANDIGAVLTAVVTINPQLLALATLLALLCVAAEGIIIWYLLKSMQAPARLIRCILLAFIGFFFSGITPSTTGGQPAQIVQMKKDGIRVSDATMTLMLVAVLNKGVICLIGGVLALFWSSSLAQAFGGLLWLFYLCFALNLAFIAVLILGIAKPEIMMSMAMGIEHMLVSLHIWKPSEERQQKMKNILVECRQALRYMVQNKRKIAIAIGITLLQRCGISLLTWFVYIGLGLQGTHFHMIMALQTAVSIAIDLVPLPGAVGISELVYSTVFIGYFTSGLLTASMLVVRGLSYYLPLLLSLLVVIGVHLEGQLAEKKARVRSDEDEMQEKTITVGREMVLFETIRMD